MNPVVAKVERDRFSVLHPGDLQEEENLTTPKNCRLIRHIQASTKRLSNEKESIHGLSIVIANSFVPVPIEPNSLDIHFVEPYNASHQESYFPAGTLPSSVGAGDFLICETRKNAEATDILSGRRTFGC